MDKILEESYLYDFYSELLTEHQRHLYEEVVMNDLSLAEAAENFGISRQAVYDQLKRTKKMLADYEEKLGLVEKFVNLRKLTAELCDSLKPLTETKECKESANAALALAEKIAEEL